MSFVFCVEKQVCLLHLSVKATARLQLVGGWWI